MRYCTYYLDENDELDCCGSCHEDRDEWGIDLSSGKDYENKEFLVCCGITGWIREEGKNWWMCSAGCMIYSPPGELGVEGEKSD